MLNINKEEEKWFVLPLAESYEYRILNGEGALSWAEHQKNFREQDLAVQHWEIQREIAIFQDEEELKKWIWFEMAPCVGAENREEFVKFYLNRMEEIGWLPSSDGTIRFPRERLLVLLRRN